MLTPRQQQQQQRIVPIAPPLLKSEEAVQQVQVQVESSSSGCGGSTGGTRGAKSGGTAPAPVAVSTSAADSAAPAVREEDPQSEGAMMAMAALEEFVRVQTKNADMKAAALMKQVHRIDDRDHGLAVRTMRDIFLHIYSRIFLAFDFPHMQPHFLSNLHVDA